MRVQNITKFGKRTDFYLQYLLNEGKKYLYARPFEINAAQNCFKLGYDREIGLIANFVQSLFTLPFCEELNTDLDP